MSEAFVDLTYDEIQVLCEILGLPAPLGVLEDEIEYPEQIVNRLRATARASLEARRIVTPRADGADVNDAVATILDLAATPSIITSIELQRSVEVELRFLLCDEQLGVEVAAIAPSAYRFTPFVTRDLTARVTRITDLRPADVADIAPVTLSPSDLERAVEVADVDLVGACDLLQTLGVPEASAQVLAEALAERKASITVTTLHKPSDELLEGGTVSWIDTGLRGNWLSETPDDAIDDESLQLRPVAAKAIIDELISYLPADEQAQGA